MSKDTAYIIPAGDVAQYVSPETYQVTVDGVTWVYYNGEPIVELGRKKALDSMWVHPEPKFQYGRCKMIKRDGERCKQGVRQGWTVCKYHGAGGTDAPAGRPPVNGIYSKHLPTRYIADFEEYMANPNLIAMREGMALIDVRVGELLQCLETADAPQAWNKIAVALAMIEKDIKDAKFDNLQGIVDVIRDAITAHKNDRDVWHELIHLIDERRKIADVERRRIEAARKYLTLQEANAMMAFFTASVMKHVSDPKERTLISNDMRVFGEDLEG